MYPPAAGSRRLVVATAVELTRNAGDHLIAARTILNRDYCDEVFAGAAPPGWGSFTSRSAWARTSPSGRSVEHHDREPPASWQSGRLARVRSTEFKSIRAGATDATIKNQLRAAQGQAPNVVIDARSNGLDENSASLGLRRFLGSPWAQRRYTTILILGDDYMIETASPDGAAQ